MLHNLCNVLCHPAYVVVRPKPLSGSARHKSMKLIVVSAIGFLTIDISLCITVSCLAISFKDKKYFCLHLIGLRSFRVAFLVTIPLLSAFKNGIHHANSVSHNTSASYDNATATFAVFPVINRISSWIYPQLSDLLGG